MFSRLGAAVRELGWGMLHILYPALCYACEKSLTRDAVHFCTACRGALLSEPHPCCPRCASTVGPFANVVEGCPRCRDHPLHFDLAFRLGPYEGLLRDLILRLKHRSGEDLADVLGLLWARQAGPRLRPLGIQAVVPIPLHWRRRFERGYNQSEILAYGLARELHQRCRPAWLRRIRNTPKQTLQSVPDRRENVRSAFQARAGAPLAGKTILLVDDVLTTGSTCSDAARALRASGAARVVVAVLAAGH